MGNLAVLGTTLFVLVLGDHALLRKFPLPPWVPDPELHYRLRPNATYEFGGKTVRIDSHGFHDDEFPVAKPPGELRLVCLGDSVTMGHGVMRDETYVNQLERLLRTSELGYASVQAIDTGVRRDACSGFSSTITC